MPPAVDEEIGGGEGGAARALSSRDMTGTVFDDSLGTTVSAATAAVAASEAEAMVAAGEDSAVPAASSSAPSRATKRFKKKKKRGDSSSTSHYGGDEERKLRRRRKKSGTSDEERVMKYGSLLLLVAQMVGLVLLMRYTRTRKGGEMYLASAAVFVTELIKLFVCFSVIFVQQGSDPARFVAELRAHTIDSPWEVLKLSVPSLLYSIQNNLLYLALTNLDAATYQVLSQLKILTTALFSAVLLRRAFSPLKWSSLIVLAIGVAIVQTSGSGDAHHAAAPEEHNAQMRTTGLIAVVVAACTSGFSGVYFERILKGSDTGLWERNVQMGLPSVMIAFVMMHVRDHDAVAGRGLLSGFTGMVWAVLMLQVAGGLLVAIVVKYADNVLKVFATSFSIVISCIVSACLFDFRPDLRFVFGTFLVLVSSVMYGKPEKRRRKKTVLPITMSVERSGGISSVRKSSLVM